MDSKKNNSSGGLMLAGIIGAAIGAVGALIYKEVSSDDKTKKGNEDKNKVPVNQNQKDNQNTTNQTEQNENIFCPISFEPMTDPYVLTNCGHSFQKEAIESCLAKKLECPLCRKQCEKEDLVPNFSLKSLVQDMMKQNKN